MCVVSCILIQLAATVLKGPLKSNKFICHIRSSTRSAVRVCLAPEATNK